MDFEELIPRGQGIDILRGKIDFVRYIATEQGLFLNNIDRKGWDYFENDPDRQGMLVFNTLHHAMDHLIRESICGRFDPVSREPLPKDSSLSQDGVYRAGFESGIPVIAAVNTAHYAVHSNDLMDPGTSIITKPVSLRDIVVLLDPKTDRLMKYRQIRESTTYLTLLELQHLNTTEDLFQLID